MSKTVKEWLEELPEPYRTQAIANNTNGLDRIADNIASVISGSFIWNTSPEGHDYWNELHDRYYAPNYDNEEVDTDVKHAVEVLCAALASDPDLYIAYQSNIAMAFVDEYTRAATSGDIDSEPSTDDIRVIANEAAKNFLNLLISQ